MYGYFCPTCGSIEHHSTEPSGECALHYKAQLDAARRTAGFAALTFREMVLAIVDVRATARSAHEIVETLNKRGVFFVRVDKPA